MEGVNQTTTSLYVVSNDVDCCRSAGCSDGEACPATLTPAEDRADDCEFWGDGARVTGGVFVDWCNEEACLSSMSASGLDNPGGYHAFQPFPDVEQEVIDRERKADLIQYLMIFLSPFEYFFILGILKSDKKK